MCVIAKFLLHRIRLGMQAATGEKLGSPGEREEVDETFIGGKVRNMYARVRKATGESRRAAARAVGLLLGLSFMER